MIVQSLFHDFLKSGNKCTIPVLINNITSYNCKPNKVTYINYYYLFNSYICKMDNLAIRLQSFIKFLGLNNTRFADEINVQRSGISHILSGRNKPGLDFIYKILNTYPDLNPDWLIMGRGEMLKGTSPTGTEAVELNKPSPEDAASDTHSMLNFSEKPVTAQENGVRTTKKSVKEVVILYEDGSFQAYSND